MLNRLKLAYAIARENNYGHILITSIYKYNQILFFYFGTITTLIKPNFVVKQRVGHRCETKTCRLLKEDPPSSHSY